MKNEYLFGSAASKTHKKARKRIERVHIHNNEGVQRVKTTAKKAQKEKITECANHVQHPAFTKCVVDRYCRP